MRRRMLTVVLLGLCATSVPGLAQGRGGPPGDGGPGRRGQRMYDPATEVTVAGKVEGVREVPSRRSGGVKLQKGDDVEVTGSRFGSGDDAPIIARMVKKGGEVLTLRDASGTPAWAGRGGR
jgi:hypothetical protein